MEAGMMTEAFAAQNIRDSEGLASLVRSSLKDLTTLSLRRAALSLPDGIFRVQTLEFDELPSQRPDRDRLVRWRLEKGAAFDVSNTVLRYQVVAATRAFPCSPALQSRRSFHSTKTC
jgi:hypothetical protein